MVKAFILGAGATRADFGNAPLDSDFFTIMKARRPELDGKMKEVIHHYVENGLEDVFNSLPSLG
ncbi:MAG: hypothetical protein ABH851_07970, partial [Methanobacteriota archaeon]